MARSLTFALACSLAFAGGCATKTSFVDQAMFNQTEKVTFSEHIAPIVFNNCTSCHRPGQGAPFALTDYEDVRKRGQLIQVVTETRYMPPWHAEHGYGKFQDERRLSDEQIALIGKWVRGGMLEGDRTRTCAQQGEHETRTTAEQLVKELL